MWRNYIYSAVIMLLSASCTEGLDYEHNDNTSTEVVNGFTVCWTNGLSEEKKEILRVIINDMVLVEGGCFSMGTSQTYDADARYNEGPSHFVKLSDYFICSHELSVEQLLALSQSSAHIFPETNTFLYDHSDWESFISSLRNYTGLSFDFPTEAQWEFAARGGNQSKGFPYPGSNNWEDVWSDGNDGSTPGIANELGLFNMADNYSEWCKDVYSEYESACFQENPCNMFVENSGDMLYNVVRGGCSESNSIADHWNSESVRFASFRYTKEDYRLCRSTARTYACENSGDIILRPVINIKYDE